MFALVPKSVLPRILVLLWLVTWILAAPLFHIHALDVQENRSLTQVILPHTVFSPDLPGEYAARTAAHRQATSDNEHALSSRFLHYSEIALGLLGEDSAEQKIGTQPLLLLAYLYTLDRFQRESVSHAMSALMSPPVLLLASSVSLRAPPSVSC
jgi:hypothetical protein